MKKRNLFLSLMALLFSLSPVRGQENLVVNVWDGVPADGKPQARLHVFLPEKGAKPARSVLILPGGGYVHLALGHEGTDWAGFFCPRGVAAFVLEYRMPAGQCDVPLADVRRALQVIRSRAAEWGVDSLQVGVMGSSAGGHLAATAAVWLPAGECPAFQILLYPVVTMEEGATHRGSREALLGRNPLPAWVDHYSLERHVTAAAPRAFIALSGDDDVVLPRNAVQYYTALQEAGVPASLHIYPTGGHGWGYRSSFAFHSQLLDELARWLETF